MTAPVHPAPEALAELVCTMRPDWDRTEVEGAIAAARMSAGDDDMARAWERTANALVQFAGDGESMPRDFVELQRRHVERRRNQAADPRAGANYARQLLAERQAAAAADTTTNPEGTERAS